MNNLYVGDAAPRHSVCEAPPPGLELAVTDVMAETDGPEFQEFSKFLKPFGVHVGLAEKIFQHYGPSALNVVRADPYRLVWDVTGIGFKTADRVARRLGWPLTMPSRLDAGIVYTLRQTAKDGHVYIPLPYLIGCAVPLLKVEEYWLASALDRLKDKGHIQQETLPGQAQTAIYLASLHRAEIGVATALRRVLCSVESRLADCYGIELEDECELSPEQYRAVHIALNSKVSILTGQPGTGKTTALRVLIHQLEMRGRRYALACPTGRAAKRLQEVTERDAQTIHRLLGYSPKFGFTFNASQQLEVEMVIVDEASMIDLPLMHYLVQALDPATHLLLVGDVNQLPSVGPGNVLGDFIASNQIPVARLTQIFRQAANSLIITNAERINQGKMPIFGKGESDFFLFEQADPDTAAAWVVDIVKNRIPQKFGFDPLEEIQVLTPMRKGKVGVDNLNRLLQEALNPPQPDKPEQQIGKRIFRVGDRVMQIRNDYFKEVVNGDVGRVVDVDSEKKTLAVAYDNGKQLVPYTWSEVGDLRHAFAATIHKAQGSEFPVVVIPILKQQRRMLKRNLLYTAITRAKELCVLVGTCQAIRMAVENVSEVKRWSGLIARLQD